MPDGMKTSVVRDEQSFGIFQRFAIVQLARFLNFSEQLFPANFSGVEIFIPFLQIFDRGVHRAVAGLFEIGNIQCVACAFFIRIVGQRAIWDQRRMVVTELRVPHPERRENVFCCEFPQRLAARAFHNHRQKKESSVAVEPVTSGSEVQGFLPGDDLECVLVGRYAISVDARQIHEREIVAQAAGVI